MLLNGQECRISDYFKGRVKADAQNLDLSFRYVPRLCENYLEKRKVVDTLLIQPLVSLKVENQAHRPSI